MSRVLSSAAIACLGLVLSSHALAATYTVGPSGRQYTQLSTLVDSVDLEPGDIVLVDGGATYSGNIIVRSGDRGAAGNPVTFRWNRSTGSTRPVLSGGTHTIKFQQSNHVVFEGFDVRGGSLSCIFSEAHDVTVRDTIVRDCPSHGILGADNNSGSFTLEYSEIFNSGSGTSRHPIYMQSDEVAYPGSVFLMRYNYVHDGNGGNLLKNRHERALIHYNWFENSAYQELELIGPDCETQQSGWTPALRREDVDMVGNVIVHSASWRNAIRAGGDLNGRSQGRLRMVNNTIIFNRAGIANAVLVQLGLESLEMHNNVVYQTGTGAAPNVLRVHEASEVEAPYCAPTSREPWTSGRKVAGSNNWVQTSATLVPTEWTGTLRGGDPGFTNLAQFQLRPTANSPLVSAGNPQPPSPAAFPFPSPLLLPQFDPPLRAKLAIAAQVARVPGARIDIGALESAAGGGQRLRRNGSAPLAPPGSGASANGVATPAAAVARQAAGAATPAPATQADADATQRPAERRADLRIAPPVLMLWQRLRHWYAELSDRGAAAPQ
ncbi:MAG TPA: right-handed parallel beta-helix repeat-containing protein [Luteimonas sp.]|nr:right-handed parallel beta-helix repeat-containing protein [Luteimonas sp.]